MRVSPFQPKCRDQIDFVVASSQLAKDEYTLIFGSGDRRRIDHARDLSHKLVQRPSTRNYSFIDVLNCPYRKYLGS